MAGGTLVLSARDTTERADFSLSELFGLSLGPSSSAMAAFLAPTAALPAVAAHSVSRPCAPASVLLLTRSCPARRRPRARREGPGRQRAVRGAERGRGVWFLPSRVSPHPLGTALTPPCSTRRARTATVVMAAPVVSRSSPQPGPGRGGPVGAGQTTTRRRTRGPCHRCPLASAPGRLPGRSSPPAVCSARALATSCRSALFGVHTRRLRAACDP